MPDSFVFVNHYSFQGFKKYNDLKQRSSRQESHTLRRSVALFFHFQSKKIKQMPEILGKLFLIPVPLAAETIHYLPPVVIKKATTLKYYFVEEVKTARRFLKAMNQATDIDRITFSKIGQHDEIDFQLLEKWLTAGYEVGIMSEAGSPCVADPGRKLVAHTHQMGATVIPLPGPNSMLLALMASGLNGQSFRFSGYLPLKQPARDRAIKQLEQRSAQYAETQIFMETPYRNNQLLKELITLCKKNTQIGVAADLNAACEFIKTLTVEKWKDFTPDLHKHPAVFTLLAE